MHICILVGSVPEIEMDELFHGEEVLGWGDHWHGELVLQGALLSHVEGGLADEYRLSVLDGLHRAHTETAAVSGAFHLVQHWNFWIPFRPKRQMMEITSRLTGTNFVKPFQ